jgi:hypothetical protein
MPYSAKEENMRKIEWAVVVGGFLTTHSAALMAQEQGADGYSGSPPTSDVRLHKLGDMSPFSEDQGKAPEGAEAKQPAPPPAATNAAAHPQEEGIRAPDEGQASDADRGTGQ